MTHFKNLNLPESRLKMQQFVPFYFYTSYNSWPGNTTLAGRTGFLLGNVITSPDLIPKETNSAWFTKRGIEAGTKNYGI